MTTDFRRGHESVDEVIDRVAAAMTAVPGEPGFATRLAGRLPARRASWLEPRGMAAAALAVAAVVLAVSLTIRRAEPGRHPDTRLATGSGAPAATMAPPTPSDVVSAAAATVTGPARTPARPRRTYISHDHLVPQIAALPAPAPLGVGNVDPMLLTIEPVELAPLDLADLTFRDLDSPDHPKE